MRFKKEDGSSFPDWEENKLGNVVGVARGGSPRPIQAFITTADNGVPWIKIGDIEVGARFIETTAEKIKPEGIKKSREIYPGDFVLSNSMSFGRPYISKIYGCIHDGWLVLRNSKGVVLSEFLYELLSSDDIKRKFLAAAAGSAVKNLKSETVKDVYIGIPHIEEQQKIASFLTAVDEKISKLQRKLEHLQTYKRGVMQKLFSQEIRFKREDGSSFPNWEEKTLSELTTLMQSGLSRLLNDQNIGLPVIRSNNIQDGMLDIQDIKYWYREDPQGANTANYFLEENNLLVNFINSIAQIGKVALYKNYLSNTSDRFKD